MVADRFKPSVSTPLLRRLFGNERAREIEELQQLYSYTRARHEASPYARPSVVIAHEVTRVMDYVHHYAPTALWGAFAEAVEAMLRPERHIFEFPEVRVEHLQLNEQVGLRDFLLKKNRFLDSPETALELIHETMTRLFVGIAEQLPRAETPSPFTISLIHTLPDLGSDMCRIVNTLAEDHLLGLFNDIKDRLYRNLCDVSGNVAYEEQKRPWKHANDSALPLDELNDSYLGGTPFHRLFQTPVPLKFTQEERFNHMHVVGGTGAGKTTLLENLILNDLVSGDTPGLIVVDSQGDLLRKLTRLAVFDPDEGKLGGRFVFITPRDIAHPPAVNVFDVNRARLGTYDEATKEQVIAGVIQTFDYLFAGLLGADLTAKQSVFFKYVARLMLALPETLGRNATILDMMHLMEDPAPYRPAIESLPPIPRAFFERDFMSKTFTQTKEQIRYRLQGIIENPTLARLFTSSRTKIDLFEEMNRGSIIFVDTAKDFLKDAHSHFGRIIISLVLQATLERAAIPERERRPTFLIVDEAASYFDGNIDDLLTDARKYKLGCVFAHQYLDQAAPSLRASLAANTSIKFAAGVSTADARALAADMRTSVDFILKQPSLQFACHIRNVTPHAVSIPVIPGLPDRADQLSAAQYERLREINRSRVSIAKEDKVGMDRVDAGVDTESVEGEHGSVPQADPAEPVEGW
jgi:hypothetical protein